MSIQGIILDENNRMIKKDNKVYCQIDFGEGNIQNQFVDEPLIIGSPEAAAGGTYFIAEDCGSLNVPNDINEKTEKEFQWTNPMIKLLIQTYRTVKEGGGYKIKLQKQLWQRIADKMSENGYTVSGPQCDSKWKGFMKMYKKYKDKENTTGEAGGEVWDHFDAMDDILFNKPAISPVALSSNLKDIAWR